MSAHGTNPLATSAMQPFSSFSFQEQMSRVAAPSYNLKKGRFESAQ